MPRRIQMTRQRPWRKDHPDAVIVARPSKWGNPYTIQRGRTAGRFDIIHRDGSHVATVTGGGVDHAREVAVDLFRLKVAPTLDVTELAGRDLACWCPLEDAEGNRAPCHADVLLELANGGVRCATTPPRAVSASTVGTPAPPPSTHHYATPAQP